jgi:hypothetical protein
VNPRESSSQRTGRWQKRFTHAARLVCLVGPLVAASAAAGCKVEIEPGKLQAPSPPEKVPKDAVWVSRADGGVFLVVRSAGVFRPDLYSVEVYDDRTGFRIHHGVLRLEPSRSGRFPVGEAASYSSWDGKTLHLKDGRRLVAPAPGG